MFHIIRLCLLIVMMYANPTMEIINSLDNVLDPGIFPVEAWPSHWRRVE